MSPSSRSAATRPVLSSSPASGFTALLGIASSGKITNLSALDVAVAQALASVADPWSLPTLSSIVHNCVRHRWFQSLDYLLAHPSRPANWQVKFFATPGTSALVAKGDSGFLGCLLALGVDPGRFSRYPLVLRHLTKDDLQVALRSPAGDALVASACDHIVTRGQATKAVVEYFTRLLTSLYTVQSATPLSTQLLARLSALALDSDRHPAAYARLLGALLASPVSHRFLPLLQVSGSPSSAPVSLAGAISRQVVLAFRSFSTVLSKSTRELIQLGTSSATLATASPTTVAWSLLGNLLVSLTAWAEKTTYGFGAKPRHTLYSDRFSSSLPGILGEFAPTLAKRSGKIWPAISQLLLQDWPAERRHHLVQGVLLATLVLNQDLRSLPGFTAHAPAFVQAFQTWYAHPWSQAKGATNHAILTSAYLEVIRQELASGSPRPDLPAVLGAFVTSAASARHVVQILTAPSAQTPALTWGPAWEDLYTSLSARLTKKDKSSTQPALDRWRLQLVLPPAPVRGAPTTPILGRPRL